MAHFCLKSAALLLALLTVAVLAVQARPYNDTSLRALLKSPPDCATPCFLGIQPGITSGDAAVRLLRKHQWVDPQSITASFDAINHVTWIAWAWNGSQPDYLGRGGFVNFYTDDDRRVRVVIVRTRFGLGDMVLSLGQPPQGSLNPKQNIAIYPKQNVYVVNPLDCHRFWEEPLDVYFVTPSRFLEFNTRFDIHTYDWILEHRQEFCRGMF